MQTSAFSNVLSTFRSGLTAACVLMVSMFAGTAKANCQTFLLPYFTWAAASGKKVAFSYVSLQADGRAGYVMNNFSTVGALDYNAATGNLDTRINKIGVVDQLFSDRWSPPNQPFWIDESDLIDVVVTPTGNVTIYSHTWSSTAQLTNLVCENNVMRGWGPPIGVSPTQAYFVFQFTQVQ